MFDQHAVQEMQNIAVSSNDLLKKILYQLIRIADNIDTDDCKIIVQSGDRGKVKLENEYIGIDGFIPAFENECVCSICGNINYIVFDIEKERAEKLSIRIRDKDWNIKSSIIVSFNDFTIMANSLYRIGNLIIENFKSNNGKTS